MPDGTSALHIRMPDGTSGLHTSMPDEASGLHSYLAVNYTPVKRVGIAVAGGSCSGKTTLSNLLTEELRGTLLKVDDYYRTFDHLTFDQRAAINYDHPATIDHELLIRQLQALLSGESVEAPVYDFSIHTRSALTRHIEPTEIVIVEGLFALAWQDLRELCDIRIYVDAPELTCLQRRIRRDVDERGRTPEEVVERFSGHVVPMYREHVQPTAQFANLHADGLESPVRCLEDVMQALDLVAAH